MKYWPVPESYSKVVPYNSPGCFWEKRGDRYHCGIDIYADEGSAVLCIEDGTVVDEGVFTSPEKVPYWNLTRYVMIRNKTGLVCRYAELGDVKVKIGESIKAAQLIGNVGVVLNSEKITQDSPIYIQKLKENKYMSMLHFELYKSVPKKMENYLGGNWFGDVKPENLLDPTDYLGFER